jgi:FkbM family methyltransferase
MDFRIIHHHVGARGNVPLPLDTASPIRDDFAVYYYDADEAALTDNLRDRIKVGEATLLPYCIGARREKRIFHIAADAYASSLYPFNSDYAEFTKATNLGQARLLEGHGTDRRIDVDVIPLDEICAPGGDIPAPDYFSIDVEGAELDILRGAARSLKESVVWLRSEMWIHPVYEGAATMEESLAYLKHTGFDLFHMEPYSEYEAERLTLGMHGRGQTLGAEVDFQRRVGDLVEHAAFDRPAMILKLYKLAFMAFLKGGNGLGLHSLKQADALGGKFFADADGVVPARYLAFLSEAWVHLRNMTKHLPALPNLGRYVHERRQREFEYGNAKDSRARETLLRADGSSRKEFDQKFRDDLDWAHKLMWMSATPLEIAFRKHGLIDQAGAIEENRKRHCQTFITRFYQLGAGPFR